MSDEYRERLEDLMARLPARQLGPRRSATPVAQEPARGAPERQEPTEEESTRPRRPVTRAHASAVGILLVLVLSVVAVGLLRSKPTEVPAGVAVVSTVPEGASLPGTSSSDSQTTGESAPAAGPGVNAAPEVNTAPGGNATPGGNTVQGANPSPAPGQVGSVQVHVAGKVRHPGVYTVPADARVVDAVDAAGGMASGAHPGHLNLAAPICDGCQIWIPSRGDATVTPPGQTADTQTATTTTHQGAGPTDAGESGSGSTAGGGPINLNTASQGELESIDGVGPVMAGRIMAWRQEHGRFTSVDQLREISGVGPKTFEKIKPHVTL
ncbi:helix-hairpin-helix domain-containing protein [Cutibacterium equinum]|uniref:Helix-hairpin-helix domain-containing protein n=1 Tax=Cutibacterium equinum TaxID=3016342 RepID=A0ABY7R029_9ACTN|nr:helix-hairpin-helix domain-containing protein [Cutibacterium equinum]WCC80651.1 helix-hairpin-helix domain-containing protein [Cutibacterium equinum]